MNIKYTPEFIYSFEETIDQTRFEELERRIREDKEIIQLYEDNTNRCRKVLNKLPMTSEIHQVLTTMNTIDNRVKKWKTKKSSFSNDKGCEKKERKIIKPTVQEMEKLGKSMSLPVIKINQSSQRTVEHQLLVKEFEGQLYQMTKHVTGTTLLMKLIESATVKEMESIIDELDEHMEDIIVHQNGQYLLPKIMEKGIQSINEFILDIITVDLIDYCCDLFGGYTIQKIAPMVTEKHIIQWIPLVQKNFCTVVLNQHGNYVVQTLLKTFGEQHGDFFYEGIKDHVMRICTDKIGCSVVTNAINNATSSQLKIIKPALLLHCKELLVDQYGNFILQHFIENEIQMIENVVDIVKTDLIYYCNNKFSSNVVERCLLTTNNSGITSIDKKKEELISLLLNKNVIKELLNNQYGNFVIQALIDSLPKSEYQHVHNLLQPYLNSNSQFSYFIEKKLKSSQLI